MNNKKILSVFIILIVLICIVLGIYKFVDTSSKKDNNLESQKKEEKTNENEDKNTQDSSNNKVQEPQKDEELENKQEVDNNEYFEISLVGEEEIYINVGEKYNELGAKAFDSKGNDVSNKIMIQNEVDTSKKGEYMVIYSIGKAMVVRNVIVK